MDVRRPLMHAAIVTKLEASSPQFLLQQGITAITQGRYSEGIALLVRARDTLILEQPQYLLLDTIMQHYTRYTQAQEALLDASRTFAQADSDLHTSIADLEQLLLQNEQEDQSLSSTIEQLLTRQKTASLLPMPTGNTIHKETDKRATSTDIEKEYLPELSITCFGRFEVHRHQQAVTLCQNRNGQAIFRYLVAQRGYRATMDALIEAFWLDEDPGVARRKLQVAISALRRSLNAGYACDPGGGYILCRQHLYLLNPDVRLTTDVGEFLHCHEMGRHAQEDEMVRLYEHACHLYTGPLLMEDRYTNWSIGRREQLSQVYLSMCMALAEQALKSGAYENAIHWAGISLAENPCDEPAHRLLILAYARQGRRNEAMKQFQRCERIVLDELGVAPMPETVHLFQSIVTQNLS